MKRARLSFVPILLLTAMSFFRQYIAPLLVTLLFVIALLAVSARIFLPSDMMAPAPIEEPISFGLGSAILLI